MLGGRNTAGGGTEGREPSEEEEKDAEPRTEGIDQRWIEEASETVKERTLGPKSTAEADLEKEDANTTCHIQVQAYLPNLYSYITGMKGGEGEEA
ncbi:hypothetical protein NDU88_004352 [Pleurodeles waltl]|uniref:Uncharacterized protein n=1 Tax=Pleurodeles waltl TaxID=8319 RepID=A0AAV7QHK8_PLEWA|nr:hypothetical protein NDU88_004352 [Pleurodeles waltl]